MDFIQVPQYIVNLFLVAAFGVLGWFARGLHDRLQKVTEALASHILEDARIFVTNQRFDSMSTALFTKLDRIEDKLDRKADKTAAI